MTQPTASTSPVTIGLDTGDRRIHFCAIEKRDVKGRGSCATTRAGLDRALAPYRGAHIVLEAGSQSAWMARHLEASGFSVHTVDPRRVQLITKDHRKTDRRDAEMLARLGGAMPELLGRVHHRSEQAHADLMLIRVRDHLVDARCGMVQCVRGLAKSFGITLPAMSTQVFGRKAGESIPEAIQPAIQPILQQIDGVTKAINELEKRIEEATARYPEVVPLRKIRGVGPITSLAFVLKIEDPKLFTDSRRVASWIGLCPRSHASGDSDPELSISKCGDPYLRRLLVQCAHYILGPFGEDSDLRRFGLRLVARGGRSAKKKAVIAVARKLAVLMHRLWLRGLDYDPLHQHKRLAAMTA